MMQVVMISSVKGSVITVLKAFLKRSHWGLQSQMRYLDARFFPHGRQGSWDFSCSGEGEWKSNWGVISELVWLLSVFLPSSSSGSLVTQHDQPRRLDWCSQKGFSHTTCLWYNQVHWVFMLVYKSLYCEPLGERDTSPCYVHSRQTMLTAVTEAQELSGLGGRRDIQTGASLLRDKQHSISWLSSGLKAAVALISLEPFQKLIQAKWGNSIGTKVLSDPYDPVLEHQPLLTRPIRWIQPVYTGLLLSMPHS